jgi:hypothetical protein
MSRALLLLTLLVTACGPVTTAVPASGQQAPEPAAQRHVGGARLYAFDGGIAVRAENGARLPIANGWVEPRFASFPPGARTDLDIVVVSATTQSPVSADVTVTYEMLDMGHGAMAEHAVPTMPGHHVARIDLSMVGTWRFKIRVLLDGVTSNVVLLLSESEL